ncbi:DMT family transporter [Calidifontibacillus oryziterrae]|uniref:DMT family transporter n=1 Tax=Calidifontibacillus oryziterrae TaxID=1191699 RepID=UPI0002D2DE97|nr:DMT family transporter [Calidifontibacillus oryziterrae]
MTSEKFFTNKYGVIIAAMLATFFWGSAFPVIKLSYDELAIRSNETAEQLLFAGYRFFLAGLFIIAFMLLTKRNARYKKATIKPLLKIGLFQTFIQYVFFYIGLSLSTGIQGSIIAGTTSFFQILFAHFMYKDDALNWKKVIGLVVGFTGVVLVNLTRGTFEFKFGLGEFCLLIAMMAGALGNILAKNGSGKMDVAYLTAYQMLFGAIGLIAAGAMFVGFTPLHFSVDAVWMLLYLSFLSAAGFILWNNVMKYNQVGKVSMYLFFIPIFGVMLSALLLGETIHMFVLLGLIFVTSGIIIVNRTKTGKQKNASVA